MQTCGERFSPAKGFSAKIVPMTNQQGGEAVMPSAKRKVKNNSLIHSTSNLESVFCLLGIVENVPVNESALFTYSTKSVQQAPNPEASPDCQAQAEIMEQQQRCQVPSEWSRQKGEGKAMRGRTMVSDASGQFPWKGQKIKGTGLLGRCIIKGGACAKASRIEKWISESCTCEAGYSGLGEMQG